METLTNEQLCTLAQNGDMQAKEQLIKSNSLFVRQTANKLAVVINQRELFASCGIGIDDLVQAGTIGLWKAIDGYDPSRENEFLTYATPAVRHSMLDLIEQYSRDTIWQLRTNQVQPWKIIYLDKPLDDFEEDTIENLIASPYAKLPEQICIEQETMSELHEAMDVISIREDMYIRYRYGFGNDAHSLVDTATHFHLSESRAKGIERSALKTLKHELLVAIPERAIAKAEDRLTKNLVDADELHSVVLQLKSQKRRGKKTTAAVYEYLADCGGKWGELIVSDINFCT